MATKKANPLGSLVPTTDNSLVQQAYRMSMANVPKSTARVNQGIANAYARGVDSLGKGIGKAFEVAGDVYAKVKEEADKDETDNEFTNGGEDGDSNYNTGFEAAKTKRNKDTEYFEDLYAGSDYSIIRKDEIDKVESNYEEKLDSGNKNYAGTYGDIKSTYDVKDGFGNDQKITTANLDHFLEDLKVQKKRINKLDISFKEKKKLKKALEKKGDRAREDAIKFSEVEIQIDEVLKGGDFTQTLTNLKNVQFLRAIKANGSLIDDGTGSKTRAVMGYDKKGRMVFTYVDEKGEVIKDSGGNIMSVRPEDASSLVHSRSLEGEGTINTIQANTLKHQRGGKVMSTEFSDNNISEITSVVGDTKKSFNANLDFKPNGVKQSFEQAILGYGETDNFELSNMPSVLWESLPKDFVEDIDKDGKVSPGDFETQENYDKLANALLDTKNKNFNLKRSSNLMAEFFNQKFKVDGAAAFQDWGRKNPGELAKMEYLGVTKSVNTGDAGKDSENQIYNDSIKNPKYVAPVQQYQKTPFQNKIIGLQGSQGGRLQLNTIDNFKQVINGTSGSNVVDLSFDGDGKRTRKLTVNKDNGTLTIKGLSSVDKSRYIDTQVSLEDALSAVSQKTGLSINEVMIQMGYDTNEKRSIVRKMFGNSKSSQSVYKGVVELKFYKGDEGLNKFKNLYKNVNVNIEFENKKDQIVKFTHPDSGKEFSYKLNESDKKVNLAQQNDLTAFFESNDFKAK